MKIERSRRIEAGQRLVGGVLELKLRLCMEIQNFWCWGRKKMRKGQK